MKVDRVSRLLGFGFGGLTFVRLMRGDQLDGSLTGGWVPDVMLNAVLAVGAGLLFGFLWRKGMGWSGYGGGDHERD